MSKKGQIEKWIRTCRDKGKRFPTQTEIAERFEISERYAKQILSELKEELR
jgi:DNA-binding IscR family transcriptional regulator